jgi:hypothetical protein
VIPRTGGELVTVDWLAFFVALGSACDADNHVRRGGAKQPYPPDADPPGRLSGMAAQLMQPEASRAGGRPGG